MSHTVTEEPSVTLNFMSIASCLFYHKVNLFYCLLSPDSLTVLIRISDQATAPRDDASARIQVCGSYEEIINGLTIIASTLAHILLVGIYGKISTHGGRHNPNCQIRKTNPTNP